MFDERLLARALPRPAHDASFGALDEIMHLAQSAKYEPAAARAAELLDAGCKDVRAFIVYALGVFAERGPATVPALFDSITSLLSARLPDTNPSPSATRTADTALRFGFRIMRAHLDFDERLSEAAGQAWAEPLAPDSTEVVLRACADLRQAIQAISEAPLCDAELGAVVVRLEAYCRRKTPEKKVAPVRSFAQQGARQELASPAAEPDPSATLDALDPTSSNEVPSFARRAADYEAEGTSLRVSPALHHFICKLQAFEHLLSSGSLAKAAIVAHDIRNVIAAFDPMIYLPNLLAPHFRLLSGNVQELYPYFEQSTTPGWQALEQLYRVDLDAFLEA